MLKTIALLSLSLLLSAAPAGAQQSLFGAGDKPPRGITVTASGSVPVSSWLAVATFSSPTTKSPSGSSIAFAQTAASGFSKAVEALGVAKDEITVAPSMPSANPFLSTTAPAMVVTVTAPVAMLEKIRGLAKQHNVGTESGLQMVPADAEILYQSAEQIAVKNARAKAEAIAQADHQHVGRLINFEPSPLDYVKEAAANSPGGLLGAMLGGVSGGMVTASGVATFELVP